MRHESTCHAQDREGSVEAEAASVFQHDLGKQPRESGMGCRKLLLSLAGHLFLAACLISRSLADCGRHVSSAQSVGEVHQFF